MPGIFSLLVPGECASFLLGLETVDVAKHLGAFSSLMTFPAAAASLGGGSMPGGASTLLEVVLSGMQAAKDGGAGLLRRLAVRGGGMVCLPCIPLRSVQLPSVCNR